MGDKHLFSILMVLVLSACTTTTMGGTITSTEVQACVGHEQEVADLSAGLSDRAELAKHLRDVANESFKRGAVHQDVALVVCLYGTAAELGDIQAMYLLSPYYWTGAPNLPRDEVKSIELLERSASLGHCQAQLDMAYRKKLSGHYEEATRWQERAIKGGCS